MRKIALLLVVVTFAFFSNTVQSFDAPPVTQGRLYAFTKKGKPLGYSPLKHTKVRADISGFLARVTVQQEFVNNFNQPIEAIYTFPLSENSAVDDMTMKIGSRTIRGKIKKREEAKEIYEKAKSQGKTASLLDQERPNIFTQSVANILPNEKIVIEISYVENLKYEDGSYEFVFPMVVGERYSPKSVKRRNSAKVTPPVARKMRTGHDISIEVNLDAGVPIENISSKLHQIDSQNLSSNSAKIRLQNEKTIPNKDFILKYDVTGKRIEDAILTHRDERGGFFTMMLSPPEDVRVEDVSPKEIVFVLDTSGSMSGFPIQKAKEAMKMSLEGLYPEDTFNLITFAGDTHVLFDAPVYATQENLEMAQKFLDSRSGGGGTEMMKAIKTALSPSDSNEHIRIVNFMTDGYVSNESEIISEIQKHPNARVFSFGIGNGVNRYLLSKMAEEGCGEATFVTLNDDGSKAAKKFHERIRNPLLTDISIDWNGMPVADIYPKRNPDLFDVKPVVINGRFTKAKSGIIKLKGKISGQPYEREIKVNFPEREENHDVLATLWARKRIDDLMNQNYDYNTEEAKLDSEVTKQITQLGLEFRLLTEFTSFVAVQEVIRTQGGKPVKVEVPVERANGAFGEEVDDDDEVNAFAMVNSPPRINSLTLSKGSTKGSVFMPNQTSNSVTLVPKPVGTPLPPRKISSKPPPMMIAPKRISAGVINGKAISLPQPNYPVAARSASISGSVNVRVIIDENGNVISAKAVTGHPLLRRASVSAARRAKFAPTNISGKPVQVNGVIVYNFQNGLPIKSQKLTKKPLATIITTPEQSETNNLKQKLHIWVYDLAMRLKNKKSTVSVNELKFVDNGKAKLKIHLTEKSSDLINKLQEIGFETNNQKTNKILIGKIAVEKIKDLAEIEQIKFVLPSVR